MDQTQNTSPQPPKKSFWAKLFGGGKADQAPPAPSPVSHEPASSATPAADSPVNVPTSNPVSTVPPVQSWSMPEPSSNNVDSPVADPETPFANNPTATEPAISPVPSWQDTPATSETSDAVPVPPSDPMVTPVQPAEPASPPQDDGTPQAPGQAPVDDASGGDRPSITPPAR